MRNLKIDADRHNSTRLNFVVSSQKKSNVHKEKRVFTATQELRNFTIQTNTKLSFVKATLAQQVYVIMQSTVRLLIMSQKSQ